MSVTKLDIKLNDAIMDQENIDKLKNKVNEVIDEVADVEEASIPKTQKLYCHPISLVCNTDDVKFIINCLIFNNTSTPFTLTSFKQFIDNLYTSIGEVVRIMMTGGYYNRNNQTDAHIVSTAYLYKSGSGYGINGGGTSNGYAVSGTMEWNNLFPEETAINDGVNEIYPNLAE